MTQRRSDFPFRKNFHKAVRWSDEKINKAIENYNKNFKTPKYLQFMKTMVTEGWKVGIYQAGVSKYIFITKGPKIYKIRFSNHLPAYEREMEDDCDFFVGIARKQTLTTEQVAHKILTHDTDPQDSDAQ